MSAMATIQVQAGSTRITRLPAALTKRPVVGLKSGSLPDKQRGVGVSRRGACPSQNADWRERPPFIFTSHDRLVRGEGKQPETLQSDRPVRRQSLTVAAIRAKGKDRVRQDGTAALTDFPISGEIPSSKRRIRLKVGRGNHPLARTEDARATTCRCAGLQKPVHLKAGADGEFILATVIEGGALEGNEDGCLTGAMSLTPRPECEPNDLSRSSKF